MQHIHADVIIIGAGLTGLTLAYRLKNRGLSVKLIEARERIGGRIHTIYGEGMPPREMGATWLGSTHTRLAALLQELDIDIFEQVLGPSAFYEPISTSPPQLVSLPPNTDPSFRIAGGTSALIQALASELDQKSILLDQPVSTIEQGAEHVLVQTDTYHIKGQKIVSTLPPYLLTQTVKINPPLPETLSALAHETHTWMGESIKVSLSYKTPFWREASMSGTIFSSVGPIPEMYDHSDVEDRAFALCGFFNGSYFSLKKEERLSMVLGQLRKYFGKKAEDYLAYEEAVWRNESFTFSPYQNHILPHQNNGHPSFRNLYWEGRLFIAGSETSTDFPGYMEGAIRSADYVFEKILHI